MTLKEFIFALINFLILVFALYKIGRKMVVKIFATRRDKIRDSLEKSEQAKENAKQIAQKMETSREENTRQCEQLTADAQKAGRERADAILRNGEASAQQTLQEVGELERQLRDEMQSKLARQTVTQVAALTGQALRSPAFDPYRAKLVDQDLTALRKSLRAYPSDRLRLQTQGLLQASVWSAEPLRAEERDSLRQMLQETFAENGRQYRIQLQTEVDPAQIAGLCLQVGDTVYDGTIRHQLELLTENIPPVDSAKGELLHSITEILQQADCNLDIYQVGTVTQVYDGICRISGLADCMAGEMLKFHNGIIGMVQDLEPDNVGCVLLGNYSRIQKGDAVRRTGHVMSVPVGDALIGRVVNALGEPVDGQGVIHTSQTRPIESPAPSVLDRQSVSVPLQTGLKAVDALVPIGRGQRELIIGDRQTGKTAIALDTIINQKGKDVICIYVAIGQKESTVAGVVKKLRQTGAMEYSIVVCAHASEAAPMLYIAPYAGAAMAEYFMYQGRDVLIVLKDDQVTVKGSVTNALSGAFLGSLGGGKSLSFNLLTYYAVLNGAQDLILDPKSERGLWKEKLRGSSRNAAKPESARMLPSALKNENCISSASRYIVQSGAPVATLAPFCTQIEPIVPARGAQISFSIFIASRMNRTSPAFTCWPAVQRMSRIVPGIGAATASPPAGAAAGAGAGAAAGAGVGAALGAEAGAAPTGVPVTVPRSTMTSYCLPLSDTIYFIVVFPLKLP